MFVIGVTCPRSRRCGQRLPAVHQHVQSSCGLVYLHLPSPCCAGAAVCVLLVLLVALPVVVDVF